MCARGGFVRCFYQKIRLGLSQLLSLLLSFLLSLGISRYLFREKYQLWLEYHDAGCQVRFVKKITASGEWEVVDQANLSNAVDELQGFIDQLRPVYKINKKYSLKIPVHICLSEHQISSPVLTILPENYSEQDIEGFIIHEQASLFPQSQGELFFDFLINKNEGNQQEIKIFSLEKKSYEYLMICLGENNFDLVFFGCDKINFLPWREVSRKNKKKKLVFSVSFGFLMAIIFLISLSFLESKKNNSINIAINNSKKEIFRQQELLDSGLELKKNYENKVSDFQAKYQSKSGLSFVLYLLIKIDALRPVGLRLNNIHFFDNKIIISGQAKNLLTVQKYEKSLNSISPSDQISRVVSRAKIQSLKNIKHSQFSQYFEIGVSW